MIVGSERAWRAMKPKQVFQWMGTPLVLRLLLGFGVFTGSWSLEDLSIQAADPHPLKPPDTSSPKATLDSFTRNMNEVYRLVKDQDREVDLEQMSIPLDRAVRCLDLSGTDLAAVEDLGEKRAFLLMGILDRIGIPTDAAPDAPQVNQTNLRRWRLPNTEIALVMMDSGPRQGEFLFSTDTVSRLPDFYERVKALSCRPDTVLVDAYEKMFAVGPVDEGLDSPLKPADTSSPRATLKSFLDNMNELARVYQSLRPGTESPQRLQDAYRRAVHCLDLSQVPPNALRRTGRESAVMLIDILNRIEVPPYDQIPGPSQLKRDDLAEWTLPNSEISIARVQEGPRHGEFLFSPETVERLPDDYARVQAMPYKEETLVQDFYGIYLQSTGPWIPLSWVLRLPAWLRQPVLGTPVWKWFALGGVLLLVIFGLLLGFRLGSRKKEDAPPAPFLWRIVFPLSGIGLAVLGEAALEQIRLVNAIADNASLLFTLILAFSVAWLITMVNNGLAEAIVASPRINAQSIDAHMVRTAFRVLSLVGFVIVILKTTDSLGIPLTPVLAGLGVGGVAIALAAQNSIENLIGGFTLFVDRPIKVGDFCRFGDKLGTIEEIGLRSTRVRTLDDTVIAVPNGSFSKMELENFSKRRKLLYQCRIQLSRSVTPDQIRFALVEIRKLLYAHPRIDPAPARIRFTEFGTTSFDLEIFAYVQTSSYDDFLEVVEDLNLRILEMLAAHQVPLALPTQRTLLEPGDRADPEQVQEIEKQVQHWRDNHELYLPSFPDEVVAQLRETLDYPPKGSALSPLSE